VLLAAMKKAFPDQAISGETPSGAIASGSIGKAQAATVDQADGKQGTGFPVAKWIVRSLTVLALLMIIASFIWFQDHPYAKSFERVLGFVAAVGTIFSAYWATRQTK
jgi:hypothetical protein